MAYDSADPRAGLLTAAGADRKPAEDFAPADYAKLYETQPQEDFPERKTWYFRGQNFVVGYTVARPGAVVARKSQADEYALLLPDRDSAAEIVTSKGTTQLGGFSIAFVPPGDSHLRMTAPGRVIQLVTSRSQDLVAKSSNAASYTKPHPNIAAFTPWPGAAGNPVVRTYSLAVPLEQGRFGRIWRCSTFMVNYLEPWDGPRDVTKMWPHDHDDFEQCSIAIEGEFIHHIRWPWIANLNNWRSDEHEQCGSPSVVVIPPRAIHTSQAVGPGANQLIDVFCPPRVDFSKMPGWVLNAADYPMPQ
jgi:hypothetical protein